MCTVCIGMFRKGITNLCGPIRNNKGGFKDKDMKFWVSLSLEPHPVINTRVWDDRICETLYEEHVPIRYCPFCGQNLDELDKEIED